MTGSFFDKMELGDDKISPGPDLVRQQEITDHVALVFRLAQLRVQQPWNQDVEQKLAGMTAAFSTNYLTQQVYRNLYRS